jgi:hypothetical protein
MLGIIVQTAWSMRSEVTVKVRIPFPAATGGYFTMPDHKRVACQIAALASAVLYFFVVAAFASYAFLRPKNNWDVLPTQASSRPGEPRMPMPFIVMPTRLFVVSRNMLSSLELGRCQNLNRTFSRIAFTLSSSFRFTPSSRCTAY